MTDQPRVVPTGDWRIHRTSSAGILRLLAVAMSACAIGLYVAAGSGLAQTEPPDPAPEAAKPATFPGPYGLQFTDEKIAAWATSLFEYLDTFLKSQLTARDPAIRERSREEYDGHVESAAEQFDKWEFEEKLSETDRKALRDLLDMAARRQESLVPGLKRKDGLKGKVYQFESLPPRTRDYYEERLAEISRAAGKERQELIAAALKVAESELARDEEAISTLPEVAAKIYEPGLELENAIRYHHHIETHDADVLREMIDDLNAARGFPVPRK